MKNRRKIKIAFVKFAGMTIGGSELWAQKIVANLPKDLVDIDYYYCDDTPYTKGNHAISPTNEDRVAYVKKSGVNVIKFNVQKKDIRWPTHPWIGTDFWEKFDPKKYDIVQTVKAGPKEYPYYKIQLPIVEIVALALRPDKSSNIAWSFHSSPWQRAQWVRKGGSIEKSSVLVAPVELPQSTENYRKELNIPADAIVAGFHQRADNNIASPIPLQAFSDIQKKYPRESKNWHFIIKNGGSFYREQAKKLKLNNIHFLGITPDSASISKFLNTLDIFAHGRKDGETFGAVFVEAMIHGLPCLSHWSPIANAQPETMGPAGIFTYNLSEYTATLYRFFYDNEYRKKIGSKALPHATEYYSLDRCIKQILEIYEKVTNIELFPEAVKKQDLPIPYGYSDMGFLYAGDMNKKYNIAYHVLTGGIPEAFEVAIVRSLLSNTNTFLDIGANTGIYCWIAADFYAKRSLNNKKGINSRVIAYEPQPDCADILNKTIYLNNWEDIASVRRIGLGDTLEKTNLSISGTGSSIVQGFIEPGRPSIEIEIDTVDNDMQKQNIKNVDFIKIDVEGHEFEVLIGASKTIEKNKPIIFVEIARKIKSRGYTNEKYTDTLSWIINQGYRIWIAEHNKLKEIGVTYLHNNNVAMYLCLHPQKHTDEIAGLEKTVEKYRSENLYFGITEKRLVKKAVRKIIPEYVTIANIKKYILRWQ